MGQLGKTTGTRESLETQIIKSKMVKPLLAALLCFLLINSSDCQEETKDAREKIEGTMDVLDTFAWASNWFMALGLYAGRQPRRGYGRFDLSDDLPKIFIPNELTGNEIVRAIKP